MRHAQPSPQSLPPAVLSGWLPFIEIAFISILSRRLARLASQQISD